MLGSTSSSPALHDQFIIHERVTMNLRLWWIVLCTANERGDPCSDNLYTMNCVKTSLMFV